MVIEARLTAPCMAVISLEKKLCPTIIVSPGVSIGFRRYCWGYPCNGLQYFFVDKTVKKIFLLKQF